MCKSHLPPLVAGIMAFLVVWVVAVIDPHASSASGPAETTPTVTATTTPMRGRWGGTTNRGNRVSFDVSTDSSQWSNFVVTTYYTATQCGLPARSIDISAPGPGAITDSHFSASSPFSFEGWFTTTTLATGVYAISNYPIITGMDDPPFVCEYYLTESGTWSAGAFLGTPTATATATRTPTKSPTRTYTPTPTYTPTATPTPTFTPTPTATFTATRTRTRTRTITSTRTDTATPASTPTVTSTGTKTTLTSPTATKTAMGSRTPSATATPTWTGTPAGFRLNMPVIVSFHAPQTAPSQADINPGAAAGRWSGTTSRGQPMSFLVTADGTQWMTFTLKTDYVATTCYNLSVQTEIMTSGPGSIADDHFSTSGSYAFEGWLATTTVATGTYTFYRYPVVIGLPSPPYICTYYLTQSGTWTAGLFVGAATHTPTPARTPTSTRTATNTRTPTRTATPTVTRTPSRTGTTTLAPTAGHFLVYLPTIMRDHWTVLAAAATLLEMLTLTETPQPSPTPTATANQVAT